MNEEQVTEEVGRSDPGLQRRRVKRYSAEERAELIKAYEDSGEIQQAFCDQRGLNVGTFKGWLSRRAESQETKFTKMEIPIGSAAPIEIILGNGIRVGIRHQGSPEELVALIRGVAGC